MCNPILSIFQTRGQGRRGRHFYPATPAEEGQDYEVSKF